METPQASSASLVVRALQRLAQWLYPAPAQSEREALLQHFPFAPADPHDRGATSQK